MTIVGASFNGPNKNANWIANQNYEYEVWSDTNKTWGPHANPGSNCELNAIIATLSTGPFGIADKEGDTNKTLAIHYGSVDGKLSLVPGRVTVVLDADGDLILEYLEGTGAGGHPQEVLEDCQAIFGK